MIFIVNFFDYLIKKLFNSKIQIILLFSSVILFLIFKTAEYYCSIILICKREINSAIYIFSILFFCIYLIYTLKHFYIGLLIFLFFSIYAGLYVFIDSALCPTTSLYFKSPNNQQKLIIQEIGEQPSKVFFYTKEKSSMFAKRLNYEIDVSYGENKIFYKDHYGLKWINNDIAEFYYLKGSTPPDPTYLKNTNTRIKINLKNTYFKYLRD